MSNIDWIKIKNEYINTSISYRKLAEKHDIAFQTLRDKALKDKWFECRKKQREKISIKTAQKTADKIAKAEADRITKVLDLADKISPKIIKAIDQLETVLVDNKKINTGIVDTYKLRQIIQSIKDLKDIVKTDNQNNDDEVNKNMKALSELINNPQPNRNIRDFEEDE